MPSSTHRRRKQQGEVMPLLSVSERIDSLLKEMLNIFPSKGEVTDAEIEHWHKDLQPFPIQGIEWAFDTHRRNGRFFPVYGEILDLCIAWEPSTGQSVCTAECKRKHGKGYGSNDILWLLQKYNEKRASLPSRPLIDAEVDSLMDDLDKHRGHKPQWRAA
jgi:hypothetical protein